MEAGSSHAALLLPGLNVRGVVHGGASLMGLACAALVVWLYRRSVRAAR